FEELTGNILPILIHEETPKFEAGFPEWIQFPEIPVCPKSGDVMIFVGQVRNDWQVINCPDYVRNQYTGEYGFEYSYTCDEIYLENGGDLYVFCNPDERTVGLIVQST
ncbi:MAG: hypothetical protein AAFR98_06750, partial [Pseudomonadota bacterium]